MDIGNVDFLHVFSQTLAKGKNKNENKTKNPRKMRRVNMERSIAGKKKKVPTA